MTAKEDILNAIRKNKPGPSTLPVVPVFERGDLDLVKIFQEAIVKIGGSFKEMANVGQLKELIDEMFAGSEMLSLQEMTSLEGYTNNHELSKDDIFREKMSSSAKPKKIIVSNVLEYEGTRSLSSFPRPGELEKVDLAVLQGGIAIAENGSIWVSDEHIGFRALPFICQHLVLVFSKNDLVYNTHQAYQKLDISERNYGVFIAGPSKTADIEQSLVIGAHGPRSMVAVMIR